jgi:pimeloyl-ACP methyl ester carboxylesterase
MYIKTSEGNIYFEDHGSEKKPVLVFTHGAGLNCRMFDSQIEPLQKDYRLVLWDMPGHGQSGRLTRALDFSRQSAHIMAILDELGVKQAVLGGHSLGSWVSQHGAIKYPERVQALFSLGGTPLHRPLGRLYILSFQASNLLFRLLPTKPIFRLAANQKAVTEEAQLFYFNSLMELGSQQVFYINQGMAAGGNVKLPAPSQPLLITHGELESPKLTITMNQKWHYETPGSEYVILPGAGHNCNQDNPAAFNQVLLDFLRGIDL